MSRSFYHQAPIITLWRAVSNELKDRGEKPVLFGELAWLRNEHAGHAVPVSRLVDILIESRETSAA